jgi:predicted  nucleic acid-binding Zn-ribbon protein
MAYNIRVKQLIKGLNVSLEDLQFYMSDDSIKPTSRIRVLKSGDKVFNEKTMSKRDMLDLINILNGELDARDKRLQTLTDELLQAQNRVYEIEQELMVRSYDNESDFDASPYWEQMEQGDNDDEKGPWSLDWEVTDENAY